MDIGAHLRDARERRGLTLEQVAESTKVSTPVLRLIERNEWERLPGGLFTRGHLRAYAVEVGADADEVVREYLSQLPSQIVEARPIPPPAIDSAPSARPLLTAVVGISVIFGAYTWLLDSAKAPIAPSAESVEPPPTSESSVRQDDEVESVPALEQREQRISLEIDPTGPCWVSARADGRLVVYRLLEAGEAVTVGANDELVLRVGDPGMLTYTLNGMPGRPLGNRGQPITVTITEDNLRSFLAGTVPDAIARG